MGRDRNKNSTQNPLGRALYRSRFGGKNPKDINGADDDVIFNVDLDEEKEKKKKTQSITQLTDFAEMMENADLLGKEFSSEKQNAVVINANAFVSERHEPTHEQILLHQNYQSKLKIPRRPYWDEKTSAEQLHLSEKKTFLEWRRGLAEIEKNDQLILAPFERNLEVWRQLWRVVERADVVVQIVDARNPLLFRCLDLERFVLEVNPKKKNLLLVNKADLLTDYQRAAWANYFSSNNISFIYYSAIQENTRVEKIQQYQQELLTQNDESPEEHQESTKSLLQWMLKKSEKATNNKDLIEDIENFNSEENSDEDMEEFKDEQCDELMREETPRQSYSTGTNEKKDKDSSSLEMQTPKNAIKASSAFSNNLNKSIGTGNSFDSKNDLTQFSSRNYDRSTHIYSSEEFLQELLELQAQLEMESVPSGNQGSDCLKSAEKAEESKRLIVGMVGYPNVGKSSTINALLGEKKVAVAPTPGKTKHFQTLFIGEKICLCDCPGLVFPTFLSSKSDMYCNGLLPIDHLRDHTGPIALICQRIPKEILERTYGIVLPVHSDYQPPSCEEVLQAYAFNRGYMTSRGAPNQSIAARVILKDYVKGKLCYVYPPPGIDSKSFNLHNVFHLNEKLISQSESGFCFNGIGISQESSCATYPSVSLPTISNDRPPKGKSKKKKKAHRKHFEPTMKEITSTVEDSKSNPSVVAFSTRRYEQQSHSRPVYPYGALPTNIRLTTRNQLPSITLKTT